MEKYFDIHVVYDKESNAGYSIFIAARSKDEAVRIAKDKKLFTSEHDCEDINYIEEIDRTEYDRATK